MSSYCISGTLHFLLLISVVFPREVLAVSILAANFMLEPKSFLRAGDFSLAMQEDCDLVLYNGTHPISRSGSTTTPGSNCSGLAMQADANLVVYEGDTTEDNALWASGSTIRGPGSRKFSYYLILDTNGNLTIFDADDQDDTPKPWTRNLMKVETDYQPPTGIATMVGWEPPSLDIVQSFMYEGYFLAQGSTFASVDGRFTVVLQNDCNLQVLDSRAGFQNVVWETTNVTFRRACKLTLEPTGKLVIGAEKSAEVLWESPAKGNASVQWVLTVADSDGHLAVVDLMHRETVLWTTATPAGLGPASAPGPSPSSAGASFPSSSGCSEDTVSTAAVMESVAFRATVGACVGGILLLCVVVFALACHYGRRRRAIDQAETGLPRRVEIDDPRPDENNSSTWTKSTFSGQDTHTTQQ